MWKATAFDRRQGAWLPVTLIELDEAPFTSKRVLAAASKGFPDPGPYRHLLRYLEQEAGDPDLSRDAIEIWAARAEEESQSFAVKGAPRLQKLDEALALHPAGERTQVNGTRPSTIAWHDHTGVIIVLTGDEERIRLEYTPSTANESRLEGLCLRHPGAEYRLETVLDWRGYFGRESAVIDAWQAMRARGEGFVASLKGAFGIVVGSVLRRLTRKQAKPMFVRDPTAQKRLSRMLQKYPQVAANCMDLSTIPPARHDRAVVFVHGTVSCGIQCLKDLFPPPQRPPGPVYRYEHDTFLKVQRNGTELAQLIRDKLDASHLLIAAHSRGGLVAKVAADRLWKDQYPGDVSVYTFGTPYLGTPLVAQGTKALNLLFRLGEDTVGALPGMGPLTRASSYLMNPPRLPDGIRVMGEEADDLQVLELIGDPSRTRAWGSNFDINRSSSGYGVMVEGALLGALEGSAHDLVVPVASALGFGAAQSVLSCSHAHYFLERDVASAIEEFLVPPPAPAQGAHQAAPSALLSGDDVQGADDAAKHTIHIEDGFVIIDNIKLDVRSAEPAQENDSEPPTATST